VSTVNLACFGTKDVFPLDASSPSITGIPPLQPDLCAGYNGVILSQGGLNLGEKGVQQGEQARNFWGMLAESLVTLQRQAK
jgi:hypothetical protein